MANILSCASLSFAYALPEGGTGAPAFSNLNLNVEAGEFVLVCGPTGCGKSTLLRLAKPQIAPKGKLVGELEVFGKPVAELSDREAVAQIGFVDQDPSQQVVCDTVAAELAFGLENLGVEQSIMRRTLAEVCLYLGIEPLFRKRTSELSLGQLQLVTLASVLALQPRLLLLDEPTSMLDPISRHAFCHALFRLNRELGITVVLTTHSPEDFAEYATRTWYMPNDLPDESAEAFAEVQGEKSQGQAVIQSAAQSQAQPQVQPQAQPQTQPAVQSQATLQSNTPVTVSLSRVWFRYDSRSKFVLSDCSVSFAPGIHALIGANGSGKSTLLSILAGLRKPQRGKIKLATKERPSTVLLSQNARLLFATDSVRDELMEWSDHFKYTLEQALACAKSCGILNIEELLNQHPYDLSGGQVQLLAFTKLSLTNPQLYLLDEPTKGLDAQAKARFSVALQGAVEQGSTVIVSSHDYAWVQQCCTTTSLLFDGQIATTQPTQQFFAEAMFL